MKKHTYKDYEYLVLQMPMGHLCGYVKVPKGHPCYGKDYDLVDVDCHGGVTYARMHGNGKQQGQLDKYFSKGFWIGFDYAHAGDWSFYLRDEFNDKHNKLTQPFEVEEECKRVIDQLIKKK